MRYPASEKLEIIRIVEQSHLPAKRTLDQLGGLWSLARVALLLPAFLRDPLYRFVARHRYRWFGKRETCRLPSAEERGQFLS